MEIISFNEGNREELLPRIEEVLRAGGVVAGPTDTAYGLFGNAADEQAVRKLFAIKNRPEEKAFPIFVKDVPVARKLAYISDAKARFLESVWPGQITVIFHHKEKLPEALTGGLDTIGIRIPAHSIMQEVLMRLDFPLAQTSANISGQPPAKTVQEIRDYFEGRPDQPDLIIDGGEVTGAASTIIDLTKNEPYVLRTGLMSREELEMLLQGLAG